MDDYYERHKEEVKERSKSYYYRNRDAIRAKQNARAKDPVFQAKQRAYNLQKKFGITVEEYDRLLDAQGGCCAICRRPESGRRDRTNFSVDHDHATGKIRGLLCRGCNTGLGNFEENPDFIQAALEYLAAQSTVQEPNHG